VTPREEPPRKLVLAVGAPDGMSSDEAARRFEAGRLPGVSAISLSLVPWLEELEHPFAVMMFGTQGRVTEEIGARVFERTGGDVLVNLICEPQVQRLALLQLARYELATRLPVVNPSWAVRATTRPLIARRLAHQAGVRVPRCTAYRAGALTLPEHIAARGHRYPVLLRPPGRHGSLGLVRVDEPGELAPRAGSPQACTVTDFVDFRSEDGLWRKYRMVYAGDRLFRRHMLVDADWNITGLARRFMRDRPELVAEEERWLARPVALERDSMDAHVMHQFRVLQLDFGVIDFALRPGGELVVFEINACVQLTNVDALAAGYRLYFEANNAEILHALRQQACSRAGAPAAG
jgi:hypothetical protein